jgi:uncharacterized membrane protein YkvA (DUF1232 family)
MSEQNVVIELNPPQPRLWDRLRAVVVDSRPGDGSGVGDILLLLPDLTVLLARLMRDDRVPLSSTAVALVGVGYVLSPIDLLPEIILGPIGLVDDLLVVSIALSRLMNDVHPDVVRSHWSGKGDALEAVQNAIDWSQGLFRQRFVVPLRRLFGL